MRRSPPSCALSAAVLALIVCGLVACGDADPGAQGTGCTAAYPDGDGDGWGVDLVAVCAIGPGLVEWGGDCDDTLAHVNPGAAEVCNGIDDDCDGLVDDADPDVDADAVWWVDEDGDGYGGEQITACEGVVEAGGDCDDDDPAVNPGAVEVCDGLDNDCDGCPDPGCEATVDLGCAEARYVGWNGSYDGHNAGVRVAGAGDVDGDGLRDMLVGSIDGATALVLGTSAPSDLAAEDADARYVSHWLEWGVAGAGDVDGDGLADVLIGDTFLPGAYLVLGTPVPADVNVYEGGWDATFFGDADDLGHEVSAAGDFDGDGFDDILVAAVSLERRDDPYGVVYLFGGYATPADRDIQGADARWLGSLDEEAGAGLAPAGDLDGDGLDDVLVAARGAYAAYVVLGTSSPVDLDLADADAALAPWGGAGCAGYSVAGAEDVNGDGHRDILFGAPCEDGAAWLALGAASVTDLATTAGYSGDGGASVAGPGDIDGDGFAEIAVGATSQYDEAGAAYVIRGSATPASEDLADADVTLVGEAPGDYAGYSIAGPGDVNGDGRPDLLVGAPGYEYENEYSNGAAYLLLSLLDG